MGRNLCGTKSVKISTWDEICLGRNLSLPWRMNPWNYLFGFLVRKSGSEKTQLGEKTPSVLSSEPLENGRKGRTICEQFKSAHRQKLKKRKVL